MTESNPLASEAMTRDQLDAEATAAREQSARADFTRQFEPESAGIGAQERELRKDAHDLSPAAISNALVFAGCDPREGLGGVPASKAWAVRTLLRSSVRTNLTT